MLLLLLLLLLSLALCEEEQGEGEAENGGEEGDPDGADEAILGGGHDVRIAHCPA